MTNLLHVARAALAISLGIQPIYANANESDNLKRFYIGADFGSVEHKYTVDNFSGSLKEDDSANRFYFGYAFNKNVALKVAVADFGEAEVFETRVPTLVGTHSTLGAVTVSGVGRLNSEASATTLGVELGGEISPGSGFSAFVELGLASWDAEVRMIVDRTIAPVNASAGARINETVEAAKESSDGVDLYAAIGFGYRPWEFLGFNIAYSVYNLEDAVRLPISTIQKDANLKLQQTSLGLKFHF